MSGTTTRNYSSCHQPDKAFSDGPAKNLDITISVIVKGKPVKAGIDPYVKLIDRIPDDNVKDL